MNRRDFLTSMSSAGALAVCGTAGGMWATGWLDDAAGIKLWPRRQGVSFPVNLRLTLAEAPEGGLPRFVAFREGDEQWTAEATLEEPSASQGGRVWVARWLPPVVRPTAEEMRAEVVRFRLLAMDEGGRSLGYSNPVEVVCGRRGWGC